MGGATALAGDGRQSDYPGGIGHSEVHDGGLYGGAFEPPFHLDADSLQMATVPPPPRTGDTEVDLDILDQRLEVGQGVFFDAWTFGGRVPGPIIRATAGSKVTIHLRNHTGNPHNLHFHGRHAPLMDGWEPVPAGGETTLEIVAGPPGVHPYHCHVPPVAEHIGRGLYGMFIVDPVDPRSPAEEVALILGGFEVSGGTNAIVAWNGVAGFYEKFPIKVPVGRPVRLYLANMLEHEPVMSFHLHAQTFAVWPAGMGERAAWHSDVLAMSLAERAMLEFELPELGRYMFHPHQHHLAMRGAIGWFAAV